MTSSLVGSEMCIRDRVRYLADGEANVCTAMHIIWGGVVDLEHLNVRPADEHLFHEYEAMFPGTEKTTHYVDFTTNIERTGGEKPTIHA
eukprot:892672-Prorocentrum_lima.AAC.1